ncbi:MAG TPA: SMP-30/gluconolactonase/LRE family protein [Terracidiphilus sp.]|jgi:sugar lactone lactonase YvrE|nr:SMP-30/gluconolactonase/LRE family protein [Terracidiphilus sp.]
MIHVEAPICVAPVGDRCGEGAVWHAAERALYWTDINRFLIHRLDEDTQSVRTWMFDEPVTAMALTERDDTLLVVFGSKAQLWQPASNTLGRILFELSGWPRMRCNDARVDPRGSLWIGTMRNNVGPGGEDVEVPFTKGVLYRIDPNGAVSEWKHEIGISNTVAWSPAGDRFYFGDTVANVIWVFAFDKATGNISKETRFLDEFPRGLPDGSAVDAEGFLWNTRPHAGCIVRISPSGDLDLAIELPIPNPTTCTFGGADRRTLYITSAGTGQRLAGSLFAVKTSVQGLEENRFKLSA